MRLRHGALFFLSAAWLVGLPSCKRRLPSTEKAAESFHDKFADPEINHALDCLEQPLGKTIVTQRVFEPDDVTKWIDLEEGSRGSPSELGRYVRFTNKDDSVTGSIYTYWASLSFSTKSANGTTTPVAKANFLLNGVVAPNLVRNFIVLALRDGVRDFAVAGKDLVIGRGQACFFCNKPAAFYLRGLTDAKDDKHPHGFKPLAFVGSGFVADPYKIAPENNIIDKKIQPLKRGQLLVLVENNTPLPELGAALATKIAFNPYEGVADAPEAWPAALKNHPAVIGEFVSGTSNIYIDTLADLSNKNQPIFIQEIAIKRTREPLTSRSLYAMRLPKYDEKCHASVVGRP